MPEMDGFMFAERLAGSLPFPLPPTIMLSSAGLQKDAARCRELGIATYLTKPVKQSELMRAITSLPGAVGKPAPAAGPSTLPPTPEGPGPGWDSLRVLVAEDNPVNQRLAVRLLEKRGVAATVVGDGLQALEALESGAFDAVLMDMQMPNLGGLEATALLRRRERERSLPRLPVIAMTAHAMKGDRERCLEAGCDDYVSKPIRPPGPLRRHRPRPRRPRPRRLPPGAPAARRPRSCSTWPPPWRASTATRT